MPCVWGKHDRRQIFLNVAILTPDVADAIRQGKPTSSQIVMFKALVDTGATGTCITKEVADALKLTPIGKALVHGNKGPGYCNNYLFYVAFSVGLVAQGQDKNLFTGQLHLIKAPIQGAEFDAGDPPEFQVLLGMDVLSCGSFHLDGAGNFSWSW